MATPDPAAAEDDEPGRPRGPAFVLVVALALTMALLGTGRAAAQTATLFPVPSAPQEPGPGASACQVTLCAVLAVPNDQGTDPRLMGIEPQLRKVLPGHGFRLLGVQSRRLAVGETLAFPVGDGYAAGATLTRPIDDNGKAHFRCAVMLNQVVQSQTQVSTPLNQIFFMDKALPSGSRLLLGLGAR